MYKTPKIESIKIIKVIQIAYFNQKYEKTPKWTKKCANKEIFRPPKRGVKT
jgi:hypothetical protein